MRKYLFLLALLPLLVACNDGVKKSYWENGNLKSELCYENDKLNGDCVWYFKNGTKMMQGRYVDDVLDGCYTRWYSNGKVAEEGWYKNGEHDSICRIYSEKGMLASEMYYVNGKLDGEIRRWHDNGQLFQEGQYANGMMDGRWFVYYPSGALASMADYHLGTGKQTCYDETGYKCLEVSYFENEKHGKEVYYRPDGSVMRIVEYEHGKKVAENDNP